jgi:hypothetical protein
LHPVCGWFEAAPAAPPAAAKEGRQGLQHLAPEPDAGGDAAAASAAAAIVGSEVGEHLVPLGEREEGAQEHHGQSGKPGDGAARVLLVHATPGLFFYFVEIEGMRKPVERMV